MSEDTGHFHRALPDRELAELLAALEAEERATSRRRSVLHDRIDYVRSGGADAEPGTAEGLADALLTTERELGERRRRIHVEINELRAEQLRRRTEQHSA
jgi:hypothetical protein